MAANSTTCPMSLWRSALGGSVGITWRCWPEHAPTAPPARFAHDELLLVEFATTLGWGEFH